MSLIFIIKKMIIPFNKNSISLIAIILLFFSSPSFSKVKDVLKVPRLQKPIRNLYSHKKHEIPFKDLNINCTDCHKFSVKSTKRGPLAEPVKDPFLKPETDICHQCHLGRVSTPRRHQCTLCHIRLEEVKPKDHFINWRFRHGKITQFDKDSCNQCHKRSECSSCHLERDYMRQNVHRGNIRYTHSIKARFRPESCIMCHQTSGFCRKCHYAK